MSIDHNAQELHDRATRGEILAPAEQAQLDRWYAQQHEEEAAVVGETASSSAIETLRAQVDATVAQLRAVTAQIQVQVAENQAVRQEVAALKSELAQKSKKQPA